MNLSICIPTTPDRRGMFMLLKHHLRNQINENGLQNKVEIIEKEDNREMSVGAKRQWMNEQARGKFVVHIDSDDWVPYHYVKTINDIIEKRPDIDCIGFKIICKGTRGATASASNVWEDWADDVGGYDYVRTIYHKNPILREHALTIGFKDMRFAEDHDFSKRLKASGLLKKEYWIDDFMYEYRYTYQDPKIKYGLK